MAFQSGFYPLSTTPSPTNVVERMKGACHLLVSAVLGTIISANLIFFFALVGTLLGAFTGALIGQETESGFIRGAEIGAFYGAVLSIEVFQSSIHLWRSDESCLVYLHHVVVSLLSGRLVRERIGPAIRQRISLLEIGGSTLTITGNNNTHGSENGESCSICLQDYQLGEIVRILPNCLHMFHLPCIDSCCLLHPLRVTTSSLIYRRRFTLPSSSRKGVNISTPKPSASLLCIVTSSQINRRSPSTSDSTPLHIPQATTFSLMHPAVSLSAVECQTTGFT
uniref:RING-type domain-containing protein n=1 Tax=Brassica oleracea TaxID=3712 RepID=A0A3P6ATZ3_BRAOL|nr:unnamed protein product [Brassica oleracea]